MPLDRLRRVIAVGVVATLAGCSRPAGLASPSIAPSPDPTVAATSIATAPPATEPGASAPTATPGPTELPSFSFVPAGDPPTDLETRASSARDGVRVSIELESVPLRVGAPQTVTITVRNIGTKGARWITDGCGSPVDVYALITGDNWIGGVSQTGIAAEFKAASLEAFGHSGYSPLAVGFDDPRIPDGAGCADIGIGHALGAGKAITTKLRWTGEAVVAPDGPLDVVASFRFAGHVGDSEVCDKDECDRSIAVHLGSWLVSGYVPEFLPPGAAIDAALRDPVFTEWLLRAPSTTWGNMHRTLDMDDGTWEIGLFRDGADGFFGTVTMDSRTGEVLKHRFE